MAKAEHSCSVQKRIVSGLVISLAALITLGLIGMGLKQKNGGTTEKIIIGAATNLTSPLLYVAEEKGFFKKNGLDAKILDYSAGLLATNDLIAGQVDIATCADVVFAIKSAEHRNLQIFAAVARADDTEILFWKDRGISSPGDLRGKKVAVTLNTSGHYFLETFLSFHRIPVSEVTLVDLTPPQIQLAIENRLVDAACIWDPGALRIKEALGPKGSSWPAQKGRSYQWLLVADGEFLDTRAAAVRRLLRALLEAEAFARKNPDAATSIVARRLVLKDQIVKSVWPRFDLRVTLDQDLINILEDQARWAVRRDIISARAVPNFLDRIDLKPLESVHPESVGIIH